MEDNQGGSAPAPNHQWTERVTGESTTDGKWLRLTSTSNWVPSERFSPGDKVLITASLVKVK